MNSLFRCLLFAFLGLAPAAGGAPHIVIILVDDMGYGDAGCYNPESKIPTPHIDRLAREGMRFTDAHAPGPLCHVSRYGLMTGRYPWRTEINWRRKPVIAEGEVTIPGLLKSAGYTTAMVGKWHLGFEERENEDYSGELRGGPVDRGFESFFGIRASTDIPPYFYIRDRRATEPPTGKISANNSKAWSPIQGKFWRAGGIGPDLKLEEVLPRFTAEAIEVISGHDREKPLFLHLAYPAPHTPWLPAPEFIGKSKADLYGDFVVMVDAMIGRVLAALDASGMAKDTLLVFTSDNGPVWYDEDVERLGHDSSGGLRGMKADAWEGGHRMPFIVRWPGVVGKGTRSAQTICFTDLMATFAAAASVKLPDRAGPDSFDLGPVLRGTQPDGQPVRGPIVMRSGGGMKMIRDGEWKLIRGLGSGGFSKPKRSLPRRTGPFGQLYNLRADPGETTNLWQQEGEAAERLKELLRQIEGRAQSRP